VVIAVRAMIRAFCNDIYATPLLSHIAYVLSCSPKSIKQRLFKKARDGGRSPRKKGKCMYISRRENQEMREVAARWKTVDG